MPPNYRAQFVDALPGHRGQAPSATATADNAGLAALAGVAQLPDLHVDTHRGAERAAWFDAQMQRYVTGDPIPGLYGDEARTGHPGYVALQAQKHGYLGEETALTSLNQHYGGARPTVHAAQQAIARHRAIQGSLAFDTPDFSQYINRDRLVETEAGHTYANRSRDSVELAGQSFNDARSRLFAATEGFMSVVALEHQDMVQVQARAQQGEINAINARIERVVGAINGVGSAFSALGGGLSGIESGLGAIESGRDAIESLRDVTGIRRAPTADERRWHASERPLPDIDTMLQPPAPGTESSVVPPELLFDYQIPQEHEAQRRDAERRQEHQQRNHEAQRETANRNGEVFRSIEQAQRHDRDPHRAVTRTHERQDARDTAAGDAPDAMPQLTPGGTALSRGAGLAEHGANAAGIAATVVGAGMQLYYADKLARLNERVDALNAECAAWAELGDRHARAAKKAEYDAAKGAYATAGQTYQAAIDDRRTSYQELGLNMDLAAAHNAPTNEQDFNSQAMLYMSAMRESRAQIHVAQHAVGQAKTGVDAARHAFAHRGEAYLTRDQASMGNWVHDPRGDDERVVDRMQTVLDEWTQSAEQALAATDAEEASASAIMGGCNQPGAAGEQPTTCGGPDQY